MCPGKDFANCPKDYCDWTADQSNCVNKTGLVYSVKKGLESSATSAYGIRDFQYKDGGTLYMERSGYNGTNIWFVGKSDSSVEIKSWVKFDGIKGLVKECKGSYYEDLKTKDITLNFYAKWKKK